MLLSSHHCTVQLLCSRDASLLLSSRRKYRNQRRIRDWAHIERFPSVQSRCRPAAPVRKREGSKIGTTLPPNLRTSLPLVVLARLPRWLLLCTAPPFLHPHSIPRPSPLACSPRIDSHLASRHHHLLASLPRTLGHRRRREVGRGG